MSIQNIIEELKYGTGTTAMEYPKYQKAATKAADLLEQFSAYNAALRVQLELALIALEKIASYQGRFGEDDPQSVALDILSNATGERLPAKNV